VGIHFKSEALSVGVEGWVLCFALFVVFVSSTYVVWRRKSQYLNAA